MAIKKSFKYIIAIDLLILAIVLGIFYAFFLGSYALVTPDGARYAEIAREMVASGHFITPHLNGVIYLEKPIAFYWLQALSIMLFGLSEWSMRFWTVFFGVAGCLLTYCAGIKLYDRKTGIYAAIILATSMLYFAMGHLVTLDMTVSFFITASLLSFLFGTKATTIGKHRTYIWLAAIAAALAVLTKGLIGIIFPIMIIGMWVLLLNKWRCLKDWCLPSAIFIFLLVALPWHILVQQQNHDFFQFYFITQQFSRYSTMSAGRYEPFYYYFIAILIGFLPWSAFVFQALKFNWPTWQQRQQHDTAIFLLLWIFLILIFFSFSYSKLLPYITPVFPALALLTGRYFAAFTFPQKTMLHAPKSKILARGIGAGFVILPSLALLLGIILIRLPHYYPMAEPKWAHRFLIALAIILFSSALLAAYFYWRKGIKYGFVCLSLGMAIFLVTLIYAIPHIDHRSIKPLALTLNKVLQPTDEVAAYTHYYQDLPFYLRRQVTVVDWINELEFGTNHQDTSAWIINRPEFWRRWHSNQKVFMITRCDRYPDLKKAFPTTKFYVLGTTQRNILLANQEVKK